MTISMISCPSCRTLLFSDTIVCPACQHVLDSERAAMLGENQDFAKSRSAQVPCRNCGEANQIGLVRCWNCSSFLREDIQEAYYEMLRAHRQTTYSQPGYREDADSRAESGAYGEGDDDFELSGAYKVNHPPAESADTPPRSPSNGSGPKSPAESPQKADVQEADAEAERTPEEGAGEENHSVATGGDVLLDIALKEEKESEKGQKKRSPKGDKSGQVPSDERLAAQKKALARKRAAQRKAAERKRKYGVWLEDVNQHTINPQKLKLKPGSMEKLFEPMDVGCSAEGLIVVSLKKKSSLFGKKQPPEELRKEVRQHLEAEKKKADLPAPKHQLYEPASLEQVKVVQPVVYVHESMFAGIPIFGEGRIAVRLPINPESPEQQFLSFWLTEYRKFAAGMERYFQIKDLGILEGVPLTDPILNLKCHYSEVELKALDPEYLKFYEKDPSVKLELIGRRCAGCGLAVSEEARRKEKIGGLNGKSIAKAKCPKCEQKFGSISLFKIGEPEKKDDKAGKKSAKKK